MRTLAFLLCLALTTSSPAAEEWLKLYDGESTFGWKTTGDVKATKAGLVIPASGELETLLPAHSYVTLKLALCPSPVEITFTPVDMKFEENLPWKTIIPGNNAATTVTLTSQRNKTGRLDVELAPLFDKSPPRREWTASIRQMRLKIRATANAATLTEAVFQPDGMKPLFNGKNLDGWKLFESDPTKAKSKYDVTAAGELRVVNGPGDLQTAGKYADFCLQFECKTLGPALNSGIFFRCLPDQYQAGYEAQIQNAFKDNDRTKPVDFGTGAIYRRVPTRKVVSNDNEWFTMTVLAMGPRLRTWVNGYPTVDWTDDRKADENARKGLKLDAGHLSIQGHDPTTNILFRNLRIQDLK